MLLAEVLEKTSGRSGLSLGETLTLECKGRDLGCFLWLGTLRDTLDVYVTMFLPLAHDEVNSLAPALTNPVQGFRFTLEIANNRRVAQHETYQLAFFAVIAAANGRPRQSSFSGRSWPGTFSWAQ